ncbi:YraN family protein [Pseudoflavitalea sp. G-6-1-2]|uniref:YraN family protein n=1 Tax=Pseudoflavitalea sp. G-6-1-2 TaxID=2728841 RepID=UPI00146E7B5D|nr:YraN family protein [Pseudoflavitalea sp. G-6-1-2]NML22110.1 YraN family protein [Pseudoflavitalea sp. G-6-1-2]
MAEHNLTGHYGEAIAAEWLQLNGFSILHRNWKYRRYEIDVIASKEEMLHFIEVKTRTSHQFGYPEEAVSKKKMENMMKCADRYQQTDTRWKRIQYDILSISISKNAAPEFLLIEDIYC